MPSIRRAGRRYARLMSSRMQEQPSTVSTCFGSPRVASRRSNRKAAHVLATIPPGGGDNPRLAWSEGTLWVGQYENRKIHQVDPQTGAILRAIESNRFVTGSI